MGGQIESPQTYASLVGNMGYALWVINIETLKLQSTIVSGCNCIQTSDVKVGSDIRKGSQGDVVFESGSYMVMEKTGKVMLTKNVVVGKGAQLVIKHLTIRK